MVISYLEGISLQDEFGDDFEMENNYKIPQEPISNKNLSPVAPLCDPNNPPVLYTCYNDGDEPPPLIIAPQDPLVESSNFGYINKNCNEMQYENDLPSHFNDSCKNEDENVVSSSLNPTDAQDEYYDDTETVVIADCELILHPKDNSLKNPIGVCNLLNNEIVVTDTFNDRLVLFSVTGKFKKSFNSNPPLKRPSAIVLLNAGGFAVKGSTGIAVFSKDCEFITLYGAYKLHRPFGESFI